MDEACLFCAMPPDRVVAASADAYAVRDGFPVSVGHSLVISKRHVPDWWSATAGERTAIVELVDVVKAGIANQYHPAGFNVGFNDRPAGGQTVPHLHIHVIPRYDGDVPDPRGGIRHVIPDSGRYPTDAAVTQYADSESADAESDFDRFVRRVERKGIEATGDQRE